MSLPFLVFDPIYSQLSLPVKHRFPIEKYQALHDRLLKEGADPLAFSRPQPVDRMLLEESFDRHYVRELLAGRLDKKAMRRIGFEWSPQLIKRSLTAVGGTLLTADLALQHGKAFNLTGGYHHAFSNFGSGFCLFNDLYLAAKKMLFHPNIERVLIVDCDVHQGDGTALLAHNDEAIFTFSLHGEKNFPHRKQTSNIDIGFDTGTKDDEYLSHLKSMLEIAVATSRPDAVIYDAGVDIHVNDDLGHLAITTQGVLERDQLVFNCCDKYGLPVAAVIGGGYQRDIAALVDVHLQMFRAARVI